ncbi:MAG: hypothetical protein GEV28_36565 [Actinophytocola sp.]|uniref:helix-turn-helix domain-containing protein n=1 Tax=Actinophytocola sp. TaxID=1872138 RepID=UPI001323C742|nr:helix-turn-helix domain-containing protein [Actinophytocola sp.]MPZ85600.1 hypothetical protein [Actinophytocola sp.]
MIPQLPDLRRVGLQGAWWVPGERLTYLTRRRMTTATQLLRDTDKPLGQVAAAIGYAFAEAFRRHHQPLPARLTPRTL